MNNLDAENKKWLAGHLERLGHGKRVAVAESASITATQLSRMANIDPEASPKNTQNIPIDKLRLFSDFFGDLAPGLRTSWNPSSQEDTVTPAPEMGDPRQYLGAPTLPVLGVSLGGRSDKRGPDFWLNGETVSFVSRPRKLEGRSNVFALYVGGDSMEPRFRERDLVIVEKAAPAVGDDIVIELKPKNGEDGDPENPSFIKELVARRGSYIRVKQYNPPEEFEFDLKEIKNLFRVIPLKELMG